MRRGNKLGLCQFENAGPSSRRQAVDGTHRAADRSRECSVAMPDHKVKISISRDRKPWWRIWNDYPDPTRDALLALFGIVVIVMVSWFLLSM